MSKYETLVNERYDAVALVELNRPDNSNSLNETLAEELATVAAELDADPSVRAVVLTGRGRFFCAGGDVKAMGGFGDHAAVRVKRLADEAHRAVSTFTRMRAPLVVAVNGMAAGGGFSIAMTGDLVLAAESASFTMAYTQVGLSPDGSSSWFLPRLVGMRKAQELFFTNRRLTAQEALEWGLVHRVVDDGSLRSEALAVASTLAAGPTNSHAAIKTLLAATFGNGLETQMELEGRLIAQCAGSPGGQEGIAAFVAKRPPRFP